MARSGCKRLLYAVAVLAATLAAAGGLFLGVRSVRRAARREERTNSLRQIGLALANFDTAHDRLPPAVRHDEAGRPLSSWRFQIAPYVEAIMLGIDFSDRWDAAENRWLTGKPYSPYCWSDRDSAHASNTNIVAVTGPGTAFDGQRRCRLSELDVDTILAVEIADSGIHWAEPGDLPIDQVNESILDGMDGDGLHVLFADGSVWFLSSDVPLDDLKKFLTVDGARQYDREEILRPYAKRR